MFGFDGQRRLHLVHDSGPRLLARTEEDLIGRSADEFGLAIIVERSEALDRFIGAYSRFGPSAPASTGRGECD